MAADNELLVRIVGDASDLQAKFEVAQSQVASTSAAMAGSVSEANASVATSTTEAANEVFVAGEKEVAAIASVRAAFAAAIAPAVEANAEIGGSTEAAAVAVGGAAASIRGYFANIKTAFVEGAIVAKESTVEMRESMAEAAATATESKSAMGGVLAGGLSLGGLAGVAIGVTAITELANESAKSTIELEHLSTVTGIGITKLAGLRLIVTELGGDFDTVANTLSKMLRAQEKTEDGAKAQAHAFAEIGISMEEIQGKSPEEVLDRISKGMADTADQSKVADAAITLFGKAGVAMIPVMKEAGENLGEMMEKQGKLTGVTDDSVRAAREWTKNEADLVNLVKSELLIVLPLVENVFMGIAGAIDAAALALHTLWQPLAATASGMGGLGKAVQDAFSGNLGAVGGDLSASVDAFENRWKAGMDAVNAHRDRVAKEFGVGQDSSEHHEAAGINTPVDHPTHVPKVHTPKDHAAFDYQGEAAKVIADANKAEQTETEKSIESLNATWKAGYEADLEAQKKNLNAKGAAVETYTQKLEAMYAKQNHEEVLGGLQQKVTDVQSDGQLGRISKSNELQQIQTLHAQEIAEEIRFVNEQLAVQGILPEKQAALEEQLAAIHRKGLQQQVHDTTAIMHQQQAVFHTVFGLIGTNFNTAINGVLQGTQTMGQAFSKMFLSIELGLAQFVAQWLLKKAEMWAMDTILYATAMATKKTLQAGEISADAAVAAANTYNAVSAIPLVGPALAPAAAAVAYGAVMAFETFDAGGIVAGGTGQPVMIQAHAGERVLSRPQTERFEQMVSGSQGAAGGNTVHLHYNGQVNAFDRTGMRSTLNSHAEDITSIIRQAMRDGKLAP